MSDMQQTDETECEAIAEARYSSDLRTIADALVRRLGRGAPCFAASQQFVGIILCDDAIERMWGRVGLIALEMLGSLPAPSGAALH